MRPRVGHCIAAVRSKIFVFGGLTEAGLSDELWIFDLDTLTWVEIPTFGAAPCARKGASLVATEDGHKLYLFGGATGMKAFNDVHVLDLDHFSWSVLGTVGPVPAPRESAAVNCLAPYLIIAGGHSVKENGSRSLVNDSWILHLQQCAFS
jgi:N-acetylneuraminic acid mutarotase